jgi:hypothetical protein
MLWKIIQLNIIVSAQFRIHYVSEEVTTNPTGTRESVTFNNKGRRKF